MSPKFPRVIWAGSYDTGLQMRIVQTSHDHAVLETRGKDDSLGNEAWEKVSGYGDFPALWGYAKDKCPLIAGPHAEMMYAGIRALCEAADREGIPA